MYAIKTEYHVADSVCWQDNYLGTSIVQVGQVQALRSMYSRVSMRAWSLTSPPGNFPHISNPRQDTLLWSTKHVLIMTTKTGDQGPPQDLASHADIQPSAKSAPPPETPAAVQTRFRVIAAFWAVIIFLGFPIWWKTTSIYRASLPIEEMVDWADGKVWPGNRLWHRCVGC